MRQGTGSGEREEERKGLGGGAGDGECLLFSCFAEPLATRDCGQAVSFISILLRIVLTFRTALLNGEQPIESRVVEMEVWGEERAWQTPHCTKDCEK